MKHFTSWFLAILLAEVLSAISIALPVFAVEIFEDSPEKIIGEVLEESGTDSLKAEASENDAGYNESVEETSLESVPFVSAPIENDSTDQCTAPNNIIKETTEEGSTGETRSTPSQEAVWYSKYTGIDYTKLTKNPMRLTVLDKAKEMVTATWTSPSTFPTWYSFRSEGPYYKVKATDGSEAEYFVEGKTYQGIPYTQFTIAGENPNRNAKDDLDWNNIISSENVTSDNLTATYSEKNVPAFGIDCSAFVWRALQQTDVPVPYRATFSMLASGYYSEITWDELKPGDILLKPGSHVMMFVGMSGSDYAIFEAKAPKTLYATYKKSWFTSRGFTPYTFNGYGAYEAPRNLSISTDKSEYAAGEEVTFTFSSNYANTLAISIDVNGKQEHYFDVSDKVIFLTEFNIPGQYEYFLYGTNDYGETYSDRKEFRIYAPINDATVTGISNKAYNGSSQTQNPVVKIGDKILKKGTDYVLSYSNNTNAGTATVKIIGKGFYKGTISRPFSINAASISSADVAGISNKTYNGSALTQSPAIKIGSKTLVNGTDYVLSYSNNTNAGCATVTITGKENYTDAVSRTFIIVPASIANADITGLSNKTYTGSARKQNPIVKIGDRTLKNGTDYKLFYANNSKVGTASLTILGAGNYTGIVKKAFIITPATTSILKLSAGDRKFTVKWRKQISQTTGYQIQYSSRCDFITQRIVNINDAKKTSQVISKLACKRKYYVRIRIFKIVGSKKYYSRWSTVKTVTTK